MATNDSAQSVWSRLREYCQHGHLLKYPPLNDEQARQLEKHGIYLPPEIRQQYTSIDNGFMMRPQVVAYPPATQEQLHATEELLGCPLPPDLRHLYIEVANGGINLGPVNVFHGAIGGCPEYADSRPDGHTIEHFMSQSGWRLHPRIEEALLRHPGRYVVAETNPDDFVWIGQDSEISVDMDFRTGRLYCTEFWGDFPDVDEVSGEEKYLQSISIYAPSLSVWFERWLDGTLHESFDESGELLPEMVETDNLPDPNIVWRGIYRFGPAWRLSPPNDTDVQ